MAIEVILNGDNKSAIKELFDISLVASIEEGSVNSRITTQQFTFVNEYAELIINYFNNGVNGVSNGILEGLPIDILESGQPVFGGYLDFINDFKIVNPTTVTARIIKHESYDDIVSKASGLTARHLYDEGIITENDFILIPYIIEKEFDFIDFSFLVFSAYAIVRDLRDALKELTKQAINIAAHAAGGATGSVAAAVMAIAVLAIDAAFSIAMIVLLVDMSLDLTRYLSSPVKYHKGIKLETLLFKYAAYLGYQYNTTIPDVSLITILPSKTSVDQDGQQLKVKLGLNIIQGGLGIPSPADYGYTFLEALTLVNNLAYAEFTFKNGIIQQHTKNTSWWLQQSQWTMPPVLDESITVNADEIVSDKLITFMTDVKDANTTINFKGTTYEIKTRPISVNDSRNVLLKGFEKVEIPFALGTRKNKLNNFESLIKVLLTKIDRVINSFGGNGNNAAKITAKIGVLKLETDLVNVPKLLKLNSQKKLHSNDRTIWSAKYLYHEYLKEGSFVLGNFAGQYQTKKAIKVPFNFEAFNQLTDFLYFSDANGNQCRAELIDWEDSKDFALLDYRFKYKFTGNLQETYTEQD